MAPACPVCREPVAWQRRFLKAWAWAKWPCPACGSTLTFSMKRRMLLGVLGAVMFGGISAGTTVLPARSHIHAILVAAGMFAILTVLFMFVFTDKIVAVTRCGSYCEGCGYNLAGTASLTCPECGRERPPPPVAAPVARPVQ